VPLLSVTTSVVASAVGAASARGSGSSASAVVAASGRGSGSSAKEDGGGAGDCSQARVGRSASGAGAEGEGRIGGGAAGVEAKPGISGRRVDANAGSGGDAAVSEAACSAIGIAMCIGMAQVGVRLCAGCVRDVCAGCAFADLCERCIAQLAIYWHCHVHRPDAGANHLSQCEMHAECVLRGFCICGRDVCKISGMCLWCVFSICAG
jgi:hypothetical protein